MTKHRILLADDDPDLLEQMTDLLSAAGYEVTAAEGHAAAEEAMLKGKPDLAIFDLVDGPVDFVDTRNNRRAGTRKLVPVLTVRAGRPYGRPPLPVPFLY